MGASPVTIRRATRQDVPAICGLLQRTARRSVIPTLTPEGGRRLGTLFTEPAVLERFGEGYRFLVATAGEDLVGVAATRDEHHLYFLFVGLDYQGQGLGRRLWEAARAACEAAGHTGPFTVNASENALGFYRRLGFRGATREVEEGIVFWPMTLSDEG